MTTFISIGSCLTGMPGIILNDELGWTRLNNAYAGRSDFFVDHFIDRIQSLPEPQVLLEGFRWKSGMEDGGMKLVNECYYDTVGQIDMTEGSPGLFENLSRQKVDVFLLDNLHDTYSVLANILGPAKEITHSLPMSFSRIEEESELFRTRFDYSSPLDPEISVESWVKIISHLRKLQPEARIYFFCAHAVEGVHSEDRVTRADNFARGFKTAAAGLPIQIFPPMSPPDDEMTDGDHYSFRLYKAMAGLLQTYELSGWHPNAGGSTPQSQVDQETKHQASNDAELTERLKVICDEEALEKNRQVRSPYSSLPASNFWRKSVVRINPDLVDPVLKPAFTISHEDRIATAGSCFAQHISKTLQLAGYDYLVPEAAPMTNGATNENFKVYPARFGNIYTVRQLLQLICRAYAPVGNEEDGVWVRADGRFVDAYRPQIQAQGFASKDDMLADRHAHLAAVREMFERATIFVFTLGLTEGWLSSENGAVYPLPPGAVGVEMPETACRFVNFTSNEMISDFREFVVRLRAINPDVKLILTVSPVPLIATYEPRHVLVSNTYSKSALRVVAETIAREMPNTEYFPSYEIITAIHNKSRYYEDDLREVKPEGVANVMSVFKRHYLS